MLKNESLSTQIKSIRNLFLAGMAMTFSNPFDLVRMRMQIMPEMIELGLLRTSYKGIFDCSQRVLKQQGILALFKGNGANLLRFYSSETSNFIFKQIFQNKLGNFCFFTNNSLIKNFISGALGSWITLSMFYPVQYARNMLARNTTSAKKTISGCILETINNRGVLELYKGSIISFVGVAIFRGTYFGIFDTFKTKTRGDLQKLGLAYISSLFAILFTYPSDTIRRRLMCNPCSKVGYKYSGFTDCLTKIYKKEGIKSLYCGGPIIFFQSLTASLILFCYDRMATDIKLKHG